MSRLSLCGFFQQQSDKTNHIVGTHAICELVQCGFDLQSAVCLHIQLYKVIQANTEHCISTGRESCLVCLLSLILFCFSPSELTITPLYLSFACFFLLSHLSSQIPAALSCLESRGSPTYVPSGILDVVLTGSVFCSSESLF